MVRSVQHRLYPNIAVQFAVFTIKHSLPDNILEPKNIVFTKAYSVLEFKTLNAKQYLVLYAAVKLNFSC